MEVMQALPSIYSSLPSTLSSLTSNFSSVFTCSIPPKKLPAHKLEVNKQDFKQIIDSLKDDSLPKTDTSFEKTKQNMHLNFVSLVLWQDYDLSFWRHHVRPLLSTIKKSPANFLLYCYYQKYHDGGDRIDLDGLIAREDLFNKCKEAQVDGYSALSAAIAAKDISIESKRRFIQELMNHGFKLTEKDETLAIAEFYDAISNDQKVKTVRLLLGQGNLSVLPHDVRRYIVHSMIDTCREKAWPLPDFSIPGQ